MYNLGRSAASVLAGPSTRAVRSRRNLGSLSQFAPPPRPAFRSAPLLPPPRACRTRFGHPRASGVACWPGHPPGTVPWMPRPRHLHPPLHPVVASPLAGSLQASASLLPNRSGHIWASHTFRVSRSAHSATSPSGQHGRFRSAVSLRRVPPPFLPAGSGEPEVLPPSCWPPNPVRLLLILTLLCVYATYHPQVLRVGPWSALVTVGSRSRTSHRCSLWPLALSVSTGCCRLL